VTDGREHEIDSPTGDSVADTDSPAGPATGPVLLWLLIQLAALSLATLRIPLAAKYPQPGELLATHVMLAAQVAASALVFPYLMRDWRTAAAVIAAAWPFAASASVLSALPPGAAALGELYVTLWLVALALWSAVLRGPRSRAYGVAIAAALSIGGAALWYLSLEFNPAGGAAQGNGARLLAVSPIIAVLRQLAPKSPQWAPFLVPAALAATALIASTVARFRGRDRLSTSRAREAESMRPITP
jgi:hypothetical protein